MSALGNARVVPQRFRVVVVRYIGEMDFNVDNAINNGFEILTEGAHMPRVGQSWEDLPFLRGQIQVLYDKTYTIDKTGLFQEGLRVHFKVPIKKKMVWETNSSGGGAVGAGNVWLGINSDQVFNVSNYITTALYKQM